MKFKTKIKDKVYKIEIVDKAEEGTEIRVGQKSFIFKVEDMPKNGKTGKIRASERHVLVQKRTFKSKEIKAPMAGIISKVFIEKGKLLKKGEKVILLSAMKMENEIVSDFEGKVKEIKVKQEQRVKEEEVLVTLE